MKKEDRQDYSFKESIARASRENSSRIILALDVDQVGPEAGLRRAQKLLDKTIPSLCGVKIGRQTVLNLGTNRTIQITRLVHSRSLPCIVDDKLNDIGPTNSAIADAYFRLGMDALTANPFAGWKGGLQPAFKTAHEKRKGIILLVYMSHKGASEGYGQTVAEGRSKKPQYVLFAEKAVKWKADGAVIGATRPQVVREAKRILGRSVPIYSPGVGAQGGDLAAALQAGTNYFIVGRSITESTAPSRKAAMFADLSTSH
jgi:orotidine-5'-phosphate decarboxylase